MKRFSGEKKEPCKALQGGNSEFSFTREMSKHVKMLLTPYI